jgi:hypothetical protein
VTTARDSGASRIHRYPDSATIGSILVARLAGTAHAASATTASIVVTEASTVGSVAWMPNS